MTEQAWSIKDLLYGQKENFFSWDWNNQIWATSFCSGSQSERRIRFILPSRRSGHCNKLTFRYSSNLWHWQANTIRAFHLKVLSGFHFRQETRYRTRSRLSNTIKLAYKVVVDTEFKTKLFFPLKVYPYGLFLLGRVMVKSPNSVGVFHEGPSHV